MSAAPEPAKSTSPANKPLWAAVGVLGVAVLAMGAALINIQTRPEEPRLAVLSAVAPAPTQAVSATPAPASPTDNRQVATPKKAPAPTNHAPEAIKYVAKKAEKPAAMTGTVNHSVVPASRPICANCGTVVSVTPIQRDGTAGGVGAVAGGVLGAVVGNQVGGGNGKTLATILGAVGGGVAGNAVEKKMKKETVYQVQVRLEDGSTHTTEQATPARVGAKVIVDGNTLQPASR